MARRPGWTSQLPAHAPKPRVDILRCPPKRLYPVVILSENVSVVGIHWADGRSTKCLANHERELPIAEAHAQCVHCQKQRPVYKGYISAWNPETNQRWCLEMTPKCFGTTGAYHGLYKTLRGAWIQLTRTGDKANGTMSASLYPSNIPEANLPAADDIEETMEEKWQAPSHSKRNKVNSPRDNNEGDAELEKLKAKLRALGAMNAAGELITPTQQHTEPKEELPKVKFKVPKTFTATDEQKEMLKANRANAANGLTPDEQAAAARKRFEARLNKKPKKAAAADDEKKNGAPQS